MCALSRIILRKSPWSRFTSYHTRSLEMTKAHMLGAIARTPNTRSFAMEACNSKLLRSAPPAGGASHFTRKNSPLPFAGCMRKLEQQDKARTMSMGNQKHGKNKGPVTWEAVGLLVVVGGGLVVYFNSLEDDRLQRLQETKMGKSVGKPDIGGPFELVDHFGNKTSNLQFRGKWMFIYFGFTYCPDICPNEMMRMTQILKILDQQKATKDKIAPIFITIDPERDGPSQLKDYLSDWNQNQKIIGMTGTPEQILKVGKAFRVYFTKARLSDKPDDYLIDHSIMFYLMDDEGQFVDYFGKSLSAEAIAGKITAYVSGTADENTHSPNSLGVVPIDKPMVTDVTPKK